MKLQKFFKAWLERARARLNRKKIELVILLQMEQRMINKESGTHISAVQRKRLYKLQDELKTAAKKRRQAKMLLRPNTRFAFMWKLLFVSCLLIELSQKAMRPKLQKFQEAQKVKREKDMEWYTKLRMFHPGRKRKKEEEMDTKKPNDMDWYAFVEAMVVPSTVLEWGECAITNTNTSPPWYCKEPVVTLQTSYIKMLRFFLYEVLAMVDVIFFLDVFVVFFTGRFDPLTGELVPMPFFKRWILPGVLMQLLLNPRMAEVSAAVQAFFWVCVTDVGPITMWRWMASFFIPALTYLMKLLERKIWRELVRKAQPL